MKYIVLPLLLLAASPSSAQSHPSQRERALSSATYVADDIAELRARKEMELQQLLDRYPELAGEAREDLRSQIEGLLYDIFDLTLQQKQWEARSLREQLDGMLGDPSHRPNTTVLDSLQQTLQNAETQLQSREENRDLIVIRRLHQLLEQ